MKRSVGEVLRTKIVQDSGAVGGDYLTDGGDQPRLSNPRFARNENYLAPFISDLAPPPPQQIDFLIASDERSCVGAERPKPIVKARFPLDLPCRHRPGE